MSKAEIYAWQGGRKGYFNGHASFPMISHHLPSIFLTALLVPSLLAADAMTPIDPAAYNAPVRVACVGDSITQGAGAAKGKSYPAQLQGLLGPAWKVGNFGLSGRTLMKKGDFPYWPEKVYKEALAFKPDVVIIMLGTNDSKPQNWKFEAEFVPDYTELVKSFQALESKPRIYVCRPCPVPEPGNFGINETVVKEQIKRIDTLAAAMQLGIIDMHAALVDKPQLLPDRVHPNTEGAGEMAKAACAALTGRATADPTLSDEEQQALELGRKVNAANRAMLNPSTPDALKAVTDLGHDTRYYGMVRGWLKEQLEGAQSIADASGANTPQPVLDRIDFLKKAIRAIDLE